MAIQQTRTPQMKNPYRFSAYMSATQVLGTATWTKLNMNTETYDLNSNYNTATYGYTAPFDGYYTFTATVQLLAQAGATFATAISKNGTTEFARLGEVPNTTGNCCITGSVDVYLTAGEIIYVIAYSTTASKSVNNTYTFSRFSGKYEGA